MVRTLEEARRDLLPYLVPILRGCREAIDESKRLSQEGQAKFSARTVASLISDLWNHDVLSQLDGDAHIRIDTKYARVRFFVHEKWQLRLKKVNRSLVSSNIATQEELRFVSQEATPEQLSLFDSTEQVTNLTAGYLWDRLKDTVRVFVICPNGATVEWAFEIIIPDEGSGPGIVPIPSPAPRPWAGRILRKASSVRITTR